MAKTFMMSPSSGMGAAKKLLSLLLIFSVLLGVGSMACVSAADAAVKVGYGRADITPTESVPMSGYGVTMSTGRLEGDDGLFTTCIAMADAAGTVSLLYTVDVLHTRDVWVPVLREAISKATGVPQSNINISATHNHSAPYTEREECAPGSVYGDFYLACFVDAAKQAVADLSPAAIEVGSVDIPYLNQVRHYWRQNGHVNGANFESGSVAEVGKWSRESTTESDKQMQLIRFVREGKKDVVLVNWQAHLIVASGSTTFGRANRSLLSADFVGFCRSYVEANSNSLFAFFQGAAGNLNPFHLVAGYRDPENVPETPHEYGKVLGGHVIAALGTLKKVDNKVSIGHMRVIHPALSKDKYSFIDLELDAVSLGNSISFVTAPYEMFDTNGMFVKQNSPFEITFVVSCANGRHNYIPTLPVFDYPELFGGPETFAEASSEVYKGVGEDLAFSMVAMLNALYK